MRQAQNCEPDDPFGHGLRQTYNNLDTERHATLAALTDLDATEDTAPAQPPGQDAGPLDALPYLTDNLTQAPEQLLRRLFDTTHLAVRLHPDSNAVTLTIRLPADDLPHIAHPAERITNATPKSTRNT